MKRVAHKIAIIWLLSCALVAPLLYTGQAFCESRLAAAESLAFVGSKGLVPNPIEQVWQSEVLTALRTNDFSGVERAVDKLTVLRGEAGLVSLDVYALFLIERSREQLIAANRSNAAFLIRQAQRLSPESVRVLYAALPLMEKSEADDTISVLGRIVTGVWRNPATLIRVCNRIILPVLLSLTLALYLSILIALCLDLVVILRRFVRDLPLSLRGLLGPLMLTVALALPCVMGMMWSVFLWSLVLLVFLPGRKWLGFYSGVVLVLWAVLLPIRSNFSIWLGNPSVSVMISQVTGDFWPGSAAVLPGLVRGRAADPLTFIALGLDARRAGRYQQALDAFAEAKKAGGPHPWISSQMGMVEMERADYASATRHFEEAESLGMDNAAFLFNFSKLKYLQLDSVSGLEYFNRAQRADFELTTRMQKLEERLGVKNVATLAEISAPRWWIWRSALLPNGNVTADSDEISRALMPPLKPYYVLMCGALLIVLFLLRKDITHSARVESYYTTFRLSGLLQFLFRLVPGGGYLMSGRPGQAVFLLFAVLLALSPLVAGLNGFETLLDVSVAWLVFYLSIVSLGILMVIWSGFSISGKENK